MTIGQTTAEEDVIATRRARQAAAYEQGRRDARADVNERVSLEGRDAALRRAYERGRRDERVARRTERAAVAQAPRRRGAPLLTVLLLLAACVGAFVIYLGVSQGSFGRGGQAIDQTVNNAGSSAAGAVRNAADHVGDALENAGQSLKRNAG